MIYYAVFLKTLAVAYSSIIVRSMLCDFGSLNWALMQFCGFGAAQWHRYLTLDTVIDHIRMAKYSAPFAESIQIERPDNRRGGWGRANSHSIVSGHRLCDRQSLGESQGACKGTHHKLGTTRAASEGCIACQAMTGNQHGEAWRQCCSTPWPKGRVSWSCPKWSAEIWIWKQVTSFTEATRTCWKLPQP